MTNIRKAKYAIVAIIAMFSSLDILATSKTSAAVAPFTKMYVRMDRLKTAVASTARVCAQPSATNLATAETSVTVNFPSTFTLGAAASFTVTNAAASFESGFLNATTAVWPGVTTATSVTGQAVTFPSTDLASSTVLYCFNITGGITSTGATGAQSANFAYVTTNTGDKSFWGVNIITDDQVVVSATVAPTFNMVLNGNVDGFATNLNSAAINTSNGARTIAVTTNAPNGWNVWVKGGNSKAVADANTAGLHGALTSAQAGGYALSNNTASSFGTKHAFAAGGGVEDYGLSVKTAAGTPTINTAYDGTTNGEAGTIDPTQFRQIASTATASASATLNIRMLATITGTTPAASDYTDTLTYVGAGQF